MNDKPIKCPKCFSKILEDWPAEEEVDELNRNHQHDEEGSYRFVKMVCPYCRQYIYFTENADIEE